MIGIFLIGRAEEYKSRNLKQLKKLTLPILTLSSNIKWERWSCKVIPLFGSTRLTCTVITVSAFVKPIKRWNIPSRIQKAGSSAMKSSENPLIAMTGYRNRNARRVWFYFWIQYRVVYTLPWLYYNPRFLYREEGSIIFEASYWVFGREWERKASRFEFGVMNFFTLSFRGCRGWRYTN